MIKDYKHQFGVHEVDASDPLVNSFTRAAERGVQEMVQGLDKVERDSYKNEDVSAYGKSEFTRKILDGLQKNPYSFPREAGHAFGLLLGCIREKFLIAVFYDDSLKKLFEEAIAYVLAEPMFKLTDLKRAFDDMVEQAEQDEGSTLLDLYRPQFNELYRLVW
jgi:hypothetical protein